VLLIIYIIGYGKNDTKIHFILINYEWSLDVPPKSLFRNIGQVDYRYPALTGTVSVPCTYRYSRKTVQLQICTVQ